MVCYGGCAAPTSTARRFVWACSGTDSRIRRPVMASMSLRWHGVMTTRSALDLNDPEFVAVPTGLLA